LGFGEEVGATGGGVYRLLLWLNAPPSRLAQTEPEGINSRTPVRAFVVFRIARRRAPTSGSKGANVGPRVPTRWQAPFKLDTRAFEW
jgi:hypothetical protein